MYFYSTKYFVVKNEENKYGLIDEMGNLVLDYQYDDLANTRNKTFVASKNGKYGVINEKGEILLSFNYKAVFSQKNRYLVVNRQNKMALYDENFKNLTGFIMRYQMEQWYFSVRFYNGIGAAEFSLENKP